MRSYLLLSLSRSGTLRGKKVYWNLRAHDIHRTWGEGRNDFPVLRRILEVVKPLKLLDIGCGSGRCFPLYEEVGIPEVLGQDISSIALEICGKRYPGAPYGTACCEITDLLFGENHFDLIVSTRVLAAVSPSMIAGTISHLCRIGRAIYLNEMTETDYVGPSTYWFKHDYDDHMRDNHFLASMKGTITIIENGQTHLQSWVLYSKN